MIQPFYPHWYQPIRPGVPHFPTFPAFPATTRDGRGTIQTNDPMLIACSKPWRTDLSESKRMMKHNAEISI